jgi:hypothetical protein
MERTVHKARSFREAAQGDVEQQVQMTPQERWRAARGLKERVYGRSSKDVRACHATPLQVAGQSELCDVHAMSKPFDLMQFLSTSEPAELGPRPRTGVTPAADLEAKLKPLLADSALSEERQQLARALILLWHDHLDAAHGIAQDIDNPDGAFVHGIMHRREPDFSNAAYWFHRVGKHAAFPDIANQVAAIVKTDEDRRLATRLVRGNNWDPFLFIEACEQAIGKATMEERLLREIQRIESVVLLNKFVVGP